ncbi:hypothetical protein E4K67_01030 [Desulfosporosinus fructosivorans]|uniref:DUF4064 domain-containing protein n=1 Tax=Desulfosporosinus fructosivorans TaxID=2018669 RepID=A0A4Z0RB18_9FIRM|nr:hypothetical protein [Desulfosporosinus fructosivorans]TGE39624.1 hypothetical protein E4K67_01030 [Desulfosporosinus fructosivorans]
MKRSTALLVSWILGLVYAIYILQYCFSSAASATTQSAATAIGVGFGIALLLPHVLIVVLAVFFNILGWAINLRWAALTGGILYCVSALAMIIYTPFVLLQIILSFIGFVKLKNINENNVQVVNTVNH